MKHWLIGASIAFLAVAAQALPTAAEVQGQINSGNYAQAETMMREVVAAKPESAKGHYIYAEILAHNARFADASREAALARQIDPAIKFADAGKFRSFEQMLEREQQQARTPARTSLDRLGPNAPAPQRQVARSAAPAEAPAQQSGMPSWVWPVGLGLLALVAWKMFSRPRAAVPMPGAAGPGSAAPGPYGGAGPGVGPAPGYGPMGGGMGMPSAGGGLMGVGLAAAGGAAAGMLAERMLERGREGHNNDAFAGNTAGYADPVAGPDDAARALEDRPVDFGNGNDWDAGGSVDLGGGSDGGSSDGGW